jgi:hypothetical protein
METAKSKTFSDNKFDQGCGRCISFVKTRRTCSFFSGIVSFSTAKEGICDNFDLAMSLEQIMNVNTITNNSPFHPFDIRHFSSEERNKFKGVL